MGKQYKKRCNNKGQKADLEAVKKSLPKFDSSGFSSTYADEDEPSSPEAALFAANFNPDELLPPIDIADGMNNRTMKVTKKGRKVLNVAPDQSHTAVVIEYETLTLEEIKNVLRILKPSGTLTFAQKEKK
jgi:hypothetical protein